MRVTFFGTTTLLFDDGVDQILFDCHFTRPSLFTYIFGSQRSNTELIDQMMSLHHIDRLRAIFISHSHHDHVMDMPYVANKTGALVYGSASAVNVGRGGCVKEDQMEVFEDNRTYQIGAYSIRVIPSLHSKPTILNNDIGQTIDQPLRENAKLRDYKEGGSFDFYVEAHGKKYMIRPSFNYIEGQMDGCQADVLFLGVAGLGKAEAKTEQKFFEETADKIKPEWIIPIHWDNFFVPLDEPARRMIRAAEKTEVVFFKLGQYCEKHDINCMIQIPRTSVEF